MHRALVVLIAPLVLVACKKEEGVTCDSGDICDSVGDTYGNPFQQLELKITNFQAKPTGNSWTYLVTTQALASAAEMDIYNHETEYSEGHDFIQGSYDPNGAWDQWGVTLEIVTDEDDVDNGLTTLFAASDATVTSWKATVYDSDLLPAHCVVYGGAEADLTYWASWGCDEFQR